MRVCEFCHRYEPWHPIVVLPEYPDAVYACQGCAGDRNWFVCVECDKPYAIGEEHHCAQRKEDD